MARVPHTPRPFPPEALLSTRIENPKISTAQWRIGSPPPRGCWGWGGAVVSGPPRSGCGPSAAQHPCSHAPARRAASSVMRARLLSACECAIMRARRASGLKVRGLSRCVWVTSPSGRTYTTTGTHILYLSLYSVRFWDLSKPLSLYYLGLLESIRIYACKYNRMNEIERKK